MNPTDHCQLCGHTRSVHTAGAKCTLCHCIVFAQGYDSGYRPEKLYTGTYQSILGFTFNGNDWVGEPTNPFKPRGLAVWGCPVGAMIAAFQCGYTEQLLESYAPIPARFFANFRSFEQLMAMIQAGEEPPATWASFKTIMPGQMIRVRLTDAAGEILNPKDIELAMWGKSLRES